MIIMGPELANFEFECDDRILGDCVFDNMHTYWFNRMKGNEKFKKIAFLLPNKVVVWEEQHALNHHYFNRNSIFFAHSAFCDLF